MDTSRQRKCEEVKRVFGIGTVVVDHAVLLDQFPQPDTKNTISRHWRQVGGPVPVALSTFAHFGGSSQFLGRWGRDAAGEYIATTLKERGIELVGSCSHAGWSSGFAQVWTTPDGARTIAYSRGQFPLPQPSPLPVPINAEILHLDGWASDMAVAAAERTQNRGGTVVLDAGSSKPGMARLFPLVDILIASSLFRQSWFGTADPSPDDLLGLGTKVVIITQGNHGAQWLSSTDNLPVPGIPVEAIDTNGAGDIFSGAVLFGLANDWPVQRTLQFANAVAAYSCQHYGNSTLPTLDEAKRLAATTRTESGND